MGRTATADVDTPALFPELDDDNAEHKELMKRARKYVKEKAARDEELTSNKQFVDGLMDKVIEQMHACDITKFKHGDLTVEVIPGKEKVKYKIDTSDDEDDDSGEE